MIEGQAGMTARASKPRVRPQRRIIERPRLIKLLDDTDARTILLIAPAGYGKTTLARQWAKTLNGAIWLTLTPAHRDVAWMAEDFAEAFEAGEHSAVGEVRAQIKARANAQTAAHELGRIIGHIANSRATTVVLDDYHELASSIESESLVAAFEQQFHGRILITSRGRPSWMSARRLVHGEVREIGRDDLAMDAHEVELVLGRGKTAAQLSAQAEGWPAVIGLAATLNAPTVPDGTLPSALHRYLAEEVFARADSDFQDELLTLALLGNQSEQSLTERFGARAKEVARIGQELGFNASDAGFELHPLLREFLLQKLGATPQAVERARAAIRAHLDVEAWDRALELVLRFRLNDLIESTLELAFKPLVRKGRLETLAAFVGAIDLEDAAPPPVVTATLAEIALRDGDLSLARHLAQRASQELPADHPLASRVALVEGRTAFLAADFEIAGRAFARAKKLAQDAHDETEGVHGRAAASVFGEQREAASAVQGLSRISSRSATDYLRFASINLDYRRMGGGGLSGSLELDVARRAHRQSEDPRARTAFAYAAAGAHNFRGDYDGARPWLELLFDDAEKFDLEFVLPFANWTLSQTALGQRKLGEAERALQAIEEAAQRAQDRRHLVNALALRARLLLQTGDADGAVRCLGADPDVQLIPSWHGEYVATRALALACAGARTEALQQATLAASLTVALDVRLLAQVARAIAVDVTPSGYREVIFEAQATAIWDPVVCGVRSSPALANAVASDNLTRPLVEALYQRTQDLALGRRAGLKIRVSGNPRDLLSPRELEVLELIGRGYRNRDISKALFIANSTTKVHVQHILSKLGVRTRSEAVARFQDFG